MQLLEHQGKALLTKAGIRTPVGRVVTTAEEAWQAAADLGGAVALKSQVPSGKRGKAGAIRFAASPDEARSCASALLGSMVSGYEVGSVLVEKKVAIAAELYAAVLGDPETKGPLVLFSTAGGMDVEDVGDQILRHAVDIRAGLDMAAAASLVRSAGLPERYVAHIAAVLVGLFRLYRDVDAELAEINPLVVTRYGHVIALDAKLSLDPGALPRHGELVERFAPQLPESGTELEREGGRLGLLFQEFDGDVGVLANGAGLTMETLDAIHHHGGRPANFLEIGGDAYTQATPALRLVLGNPRVRSLLVNFCGAFARTDVMTAGVVAALEELRPQTPVSFTIHGTGEEEAIRLVGARLGISPHDRMEDAVREAVRNAARGADVAAPPPTTPSAAASPDTAPATAPSTASTAAPTGTEA
ncbi:MAG: ATP-grasp domain-containing protein [Carbonactinosporaceae bacterium]